MRVLSCSWTRNDSCITLLERRAEHERNAERDENDVTQPVRIISSRQTRPGVPRPRVTWFKKYEEDGVRRTPDFTEIGDPPA